MRQSLKDSLIKECAFLDPKKVNALPLHLSLAKKNEKYTSDEKKKYVAALQGLKLAQEYNNMHSPALLRDGTLLATFTPAVGNSMCSYKFKTKDDMQRAFNLMLQLEIITPKKKRPEGYEIPLGKGEQQKLEDKMASVSSPDSRLSF